VLPIESTIKAADLKNHGLVHVRRLATPRFAVSIPFRFELPRVWMMALEHVLRPTVRHVGVHPQSGEASQPRLDAGCSLAAPGTLPQDRWSPIGPRPAGRGVGGPAPVSEASKRAWRLGHVTCVSLRESRPSRLFSGSSHQLPTSRTPLFQTRVKVPAVTPRTRALRRYVKGGVAAPARCSGSQVKENFLSRSALPEPIWRPGPHTFCCILKRKHLSLEVRCFQS